MKKIFAILTILLLGMTITVVAVKKIQKVFSFDLTHIDTSGGTHQEI